MIQLKYRPDVDGLRAVAVTLVLLFHANLGFSGGYIGVDVFFVISGFLITGLILKDQEAGKFRLANFWMRRIRRIIPAATLMIVVVLFVGCVLMLPSDYASLGKSAVAQQLMLSNVFFWLETGYFDGPAELKPLLHTWSLAVEEQFYLVYPFLLMFLYRVGRRATFLALAALAFGSLVVSQYGVMHHPSAAFFLLPTRGWELLAGGLICFFPEPTRIKPRILAFFSWCSLVAIIAAGWFYKPATSFPGLAAIIPVAATAIFIYCNALRLSFPASVLATPPIVFVGLISYSLYLWHWPLLAFMRYSAAEEPSVFWRVLSLFGSFGVSFLAWRFVETPFRKVRWLRTRRSVVGAASVSAVAVIGFGLCVFAMKGMPNRFPEDVVAIFATMEERGARHIVAENDVKSGRLPRFGKMNAPPEILIWGDSHAMSLVPAFDKLGRQHGMGGVQATHSGTLPLIGFDNSREWSASHSFNDAVLEYIVGGDISTVVLAGYWSRDSHEKGFEESYRRTVVKLLDAGKTVLLVQDVPIQEVWPAKAIMRAIRLGGDVAELGVDLRDHRKRQFLADTTFASIHHQNLIVLDPTPYLTDRSGVCRMVMGGAALYHDDDHLSVAGAERLLPMFEGALGLSGGGDAVK